MPNRAKPPGNSFRAFARAFGAGARPRPRLRDLRRGPRTLPAQGLPPDSLQRRTRHHALQLGRLRLPAGHRLPVGRGRKRRRHCSPQTSPAGSQRTSPSPASAPAGAPDCREAEEPQRHRTGAPHEGDTKTPADDRHRAANGRATEKDSGLQAALNPVYRLGRGLQGYARQKKH